MLRTGAALLVAFVLTALLLGSVAATEDETGGSRPPAPTATSAFQGQRASIGLLMHMPTTDPYCWQLWVKRATVYQAVCGVRPCPPRELRGCSVTWWVGSCRSSTISCELGRP